MIEALQNIDPNAFAFEVYNALLCWGFIMTVAAGIAGLALRSDALLSLGLRTFFAAGAGVLLLYFSFQSTDFALIHLVAAIFAICLFFDGLMGSAFLTLPLTVAIGTVIGKLFSKVVEEAFLKTTVGTDMIEWIKKLILSKGTVNLPELNIRNRSGSEKGEASTAALSTIEDCASPPRRDVHSRSHTQQGASQNETREAIRVLRDRLRLNRQRARDPARRPPPRPPTPHSRKDAS